MTDWSHVKGSRDAPQSVGPATEGRALLAATAARRATADSGHTISAMIRAGRPDDVDRIAELYARSFATLSFLPTLHTLDEHRAWFGQVVDQREVWVWEEDGAVLGFLALGDATVDYLYVEPEMTGRGIGGALLDHAKKRRPAGLRLWTFQQNDRARRFYERHGLRVIQVTDGERNEERTPDALYEWLPGRV